MDKDQKEIELKKLEIEKLKIKEGLFRTLVIIILTASAGAGTLHFKVFGNKFNAWLYGFLLFVIIVISILALWLWLSIRKKLKEI
ncbi:hypothetical protein [Persephonella sp.]